MSESHDTYNYTDIGYRQLATHKTLVDFDPRVTDNPLMYEYFTPSHLSDPTTLSSYLAGIDRAYDGYRKGDYQYTMPISFTMTIDDINMSWVHLIKKMVFIEQNHSLFVCEYIDKILKVISITDKNQKDSVVYRYPLGESIFHVAAYIWISEQLPNAFSNPINKVNSMIKTELESFMKIEEAMGAEYCGAITNMLDYDGITLIDRLMSHGQRMIDLAMKSKPWGFE